MPLHNIDNNELLLDNLGIHCTNLEDFSIIPNATSNAFTRECQKLSIYSQNKPLIDEDENFYTQINSQYYDILEFNQIKHNMDSSFNLIHTNLASISKHHDDLELTLSLLKTKFDIIGITEHKIKKENENPITNIDIPGYQSFVFDCSETSHGGTGLYIKNSIVFNKRDDLKIFSRGDFESMFIEVIFPKRKNMIIGCIYRHPTSNISVQKFNKDIVEPLLDKIAVEEKNCALMGDFNIDLLKIDSNVDASSFFNNVTSHFLTPFILQPTRLKSKTLIDNIFLNTIEYPSYSGNLTIQLSDHLFQFVILEGFYKDLTPRKSKIYERNFKNFSEQEFTDTMEVTDWRNILQLGLNDPNLSMNNVHQYVNNFLDVCAPYKKLSKKELKLKSKPWITIEIQSLMKKRDRLLAKFLKHKKKNSVLAANLYNDYSIIRNNVTKMKRDSKIDYYKRFFDSNKNKMSTIWKGIRSIVNINNISKKDIKILNKNGKKITDPQKIVNLFNQHYANVGPNIDKKNSPNR